MKQIQVDTEADTNFSKHFCKCKSWGENLGGQKLAHATYAVVNLAKC